MIDTTDRSVDLVEEMRHLRPIAILIATTDEGDVVVALKASAVTMRTIGTIKMVTQLSTRVSYLSTKTYGQQWSGLASTIS